MARRAALIILDGFGYSEATKNNAIRAARMPFYRALCAHYPVTLIEASGEAVGLPDGQMGNSEVGHLNLGAGRVVYQELVRISKSIAERDIDSNPVICAAFAHVKQRHGTLHLPGLLSDGGVHSHIDHLIGIIHAARRMGVERIAVHAILDGRDTPPQSAMHYVAQLQAAIASLDGVKLATVIGRFYAMDRDKRWDRVARCYDLFTQGIGREVTDVVAALAAQYHEGITDEFIEPMRIQGSALMTPNDTVLFWNFRADRAREISQALVLSEDLPFATPVKIPAQQFLCLTEYAAHFPMPVVFRSEPLHDLLGEVVARHGMTQLRIAETEKYAHVTFFFNGGSEAQYTGEERELIPSPRDVRTYDEKPSMSADEVARRLCDRVEKTPFNLIVLNFANPDMVGHTGRFDAAVAACEAVDEALKQVVEKLQALEYHILITADHGNVEMMADEYGEPHTAHTINPVELVAVSPGVTALKNGGKLADIAPTLLSLLDIPLPAAMTGVSLAIIPA
ncbi:2,3-bisphosphoglycerate-independent phosphoglycerate mutase [Chrysiogenes arsenatis]|uniref:2,3-bisphosphoglycerate-independent phosphoglycerate mutase n=1 Tax=Chrysiogenes arsenatis TaxID=309797 RepID=UPI00041F6424|nr:2,3-bisphosphoglycerate-independent phosphoglycerate mutase [Chrysiogenes arsenatis]